MITKTDGSHLEVRQVKGRERSNNGERLDARRRSKC